MDRNTARLINAIPELDGETLGMVAVALLERIGTDGREAIEHIQLELDKGDHDADRVDEALAQLTDLPLHD